MKRNKEEEVSRKTREGRGRGDWRRRGRRTEEEQEE